MKKLIIYSFMSLMVLAACRKSDNERIPELDKVPLPLLKKISGDATISVQNAAEFSATYNVGLYYPNGDKPSKFDVVVRKNEDNKTTKVIKADVTAYPTELTVTGSELITLFGEVVLGDKFDIGVNVTTTNGKTYLAFPAVGTPYSAGTANVAGSNPTIRYEAVCKFDMADYGAVGSVTDYEVLVDGWNDIGEGETLPVTVVSDHQFSFISPVNGKPILIDVDPVTNVTSIAKQPYGDYKAAGIDPTWTYGVASAETIPSSNNFVAPCDLIISVQIQYTVAAGSFGDFTLKLQKQ